MSDDTPMCVFCQKREATLLCDFPTGVFATSLDFKTHRTTCDRPICERCAIHIADDTDFCPKCIEDLRELLEQRKINKALAHRPKRRSERG